jgi:hypothetical protein
MRLLGWILVQYECYPYKKMEQPAGKVAHFCNPSYSVGRDQEDCGLNPAQAKSW